MPMYPTSDKTIDRKRQLEQIRKILSNSKKKGDQFLGFEALEFYGIEGIGKTRILSQAKKECADRDLPFFSIVCSENWLGQDDELQALQVKNDLLRSIYEQFDQNWPGSNQTSQAQAILGGWRKDPKNGDGQNSLKQFAALLIEILDGKPLILMLDRLEFCPDGVFDWLGREIIGLFIQGENSPGAIAFLAGQGPRVGESRWPLWLKRTTDSYRLNPFDFDATEKHVAQLLPNKNKSQTTPLIYDLSNGHPYSNEMLVYELGQIGVPVAKIDEKRQELAQKLYTEVIQQYVLDDAPEWMKRFVEVACVPRWTKPDMLRELFDVCDDLPPEFPGQLDLTWVVYRLSELQLPPCHYIYVTRDAYELEPTLRRLLHTALVTLRPKISLLLHETALHFHLHPDRNKAENILEVIYHTAIISLLKKQDIGKKVLDEVERKLADFDSQDEDHLEIVRLGNLLEQDQELTALLGQSVFDTLINKIEQSQKRQQSFIHLQVQYREPTEYHVTWYHEDQGIWTTESILSTLHFDQLDMWKTETLETGKSTFSAYLPLRAQEFLRKHHDRPIQFVTNKSEIPWELLHDGEDFFCLSRPFARKPQEVSEPKSLTPLSARNRSALVVGNPTGDLPGAEKEAQDVAKLLEDNDWKVELLINEKATATKFALLLQNRRYRLIHFAGHGTLGREGGKTKSRLVFSDGDLLDEDLERQLESPALIFLSACEAGHSTSHEVTHGIRGNFTEGMAASALRGGATHCLGPMWLIGDSLAYAFSLAFYRYMIEGKTMGESVRLARRDVLGKSPDFWAAWVLYGDPSKSITG